MTAHTRIRHLTARLLNRENLDQLRAYASFEEALKDSDSYEDPDLIEIVKEKTKRYRASLANDASRIIESRQIVQNLLVLSCVDQQHPIDVLELGGACGASYFELKQLLPNRIRHWSIVETAAMAEAGRNLNDDPGLSFHSDIVSAAEELESRNLAIAQGVLQYTADPLRVLETLFQLQFANVYVTRTAVAEVDSPVFTRQETDLANHGPGTLPNAPSRKSSQPLTLVGADSLLAVVPSNYELVFKFVESDDRVLSIGERRVTVRDIGFLARLHAQH